MRFTKSDGFYNFNHVQAEQIDTIVADRKGNVFVTVKSGQTPNWLKNWVRTSDVKPLYDKNRQVVAMQLNGLIYRVGDYIVSVKEVSDDDLHFLVVPARKEVFDQLFTANYLLQRQDNSYVSANSYEDEEDEDEYADDDEEDGYEEDSDEDEYNSEEPSDSGFDLLGFLSSKDYVPTDAESGNEEEEPLTDDEDGDEDVDDSKKIVSVDTINIPDRQTILDLDDKFDNHELHVLAMASPSRRALADMVHFGTKAVGRWVRATKHQEIRDHFNNK